MKQRKSLKKLPSKSKTRKRTRRSTSYAKTSDPLGSMFSAGPGRGGNRY